MKTSDGHNELLLEEYNRNVLKGFYSVFKEADNYAPIFSSKTGTICDFVAKN